jgi:hypothetical protein
MTTAKGQNMRASDGSRNKRFFRHFANPAVTLARGFTTTFSGIAINHVPAFIAAQLVGAAPGPWSPRLCLLRGRWTFSKADK